MLRITFANRFETLRDALLDALTEAPPSPFLAEQIIVPSSALRRDLTLAIAARYGICANVEFSFLAQWMWRQIARLVPTVSAQSPFAAPVLAWRIFDLLNDAAFSADFPRLSGYLAQSDAVARFDFAGRVAALFEQYMTYRPEWLAAWAAGRQVELAAADAASRADQVWQAALWRAIGAQLDMQTEHPASVFLHALEHLGGDAARRAGLPESVQVFCLPTIPPLYLDLLRQLGRWTDLRLYVLNPCREYWFEIVDRKRLSYLAAKGEAAYHETGNRLLAAWGKQTQAHIDLLLEAASVDTLVDDAGFSAATADTLLARLQNAILDLTELEPDGSVADAADRSIEIHVCHSLTRELEVLQDQLLALFAGPNPPRPGDILVVTPDLEAAAPLVEAVFGNAPRDRFIPYSLSGRAGATVNAAARALLDLLAVAGSRWTAGGVLDLLRQPIIARRFGIGVEAQDAIQGWMRAAGIRWGVDARHRARHGLPAVERFSFDDGLRRLFLGYALPGSIDSPWHDLLPAGDVEGSAALLLGQFARFIGELNRLRTASEQAMSPAVWVAALFELLDTFLAPDDSEIDELGAVRDSIRQLSDNMQQGGIGAPIPLDVVCAALLALLEDPARGGVATGAVTFTSIGSLRNLPFRIVCGIGLNDGVFPGTQRPLEFDLIALAPKRGDRQRRVDERNLFLDLILAARDRLYLSYTGHGIRDNAPMPASILVSELLETLLPAGGAEARLVLEHPLQPFSPRYFAADADPRLRSFNRELCAARSLGAGAEAAAKAAESVDAAEAIEMEDDDDQSGQTATPFFQIALAAPGEEWRQVELDRLIGFFRNPCDFLLRQRLGIQLLRPGEELANEEPFLPDFMGRQALAERLLPRCREGLSEAELRHLAKAGIEYPAGALGDFMLDAELLRLREFADAVQRETQQPCLPPFHASLDLVRDGETWRISGAFADLRPGGLVRQRYDDTRPTDYLEGWLNHLFLCAAAPAGVELRTRWLSRDGEYAIQPCPRAAEILADLLALYWRGLREPLHCFPKSAWQYIRNDRNLKKAAETWHSSRNPEWSESAHPAYRLALRGVANPLDAAFEDCARTLFGSLKDYLEDARP